MPFKITLRIVLRAAWERVHIVPNVFFVRPEWEPDQVLSNRISVLVKKISGNKAYQLTAPFFWPVHGIWAAQPLEFLLLIKAPQK